MRERAKHRVVSTIDFVCDDLTPIVGVELAEEMRRRMRLHMDCEWVGPAEGPIRCAVHDVMLAPSYDEWEKLGTDVLR